MTAKAFIDVSRVKSRLGTVLLVAVAGALLAGCANTPKSKHFLSKDYGVSASQRVVEYGQPVPRGGGRVMVGEPYVVAGRTYRPITNDRYSAVGTASWYGDDFHGRLTANGEVYDMDALSAAHPTLPLPSYARVTNLDNGRSVMVRVNDRGPYVGDRLIDLSAKAADMLDFKDAGVARVKVEYAGMARLDGRDEAMLMASYHGPGAGKTMIADSGPAPRGPVPDARPVPRAASLGSPAPVAASRDIDQIIYGGGSGTATAAVKPPGGKADPISNIITSSLRSYAEEPTARPGQRAIEAMVKSEPITAAAPALALVQIGVFADPENAQRVAKRLAPLGKVQLTQTVSGMRKLVSVQVLVDESVQSVDGVVAEAAKAGVSGAHRVKS